MAVERYPAREESWMRLQNLYEVMGDGESAHHTRERVLNRITEESRSGAVRATLFPFLSYSTFHVKSNTDSSA